MSLSKINPLEVPLVARNILVFLDRKNILNCRAVNRTWNNEACDLLNMMKGELPELILRNSVHVSTFITAFENSIDGISKVPYSLCYSIDAERPGEYQIQRKDLMKILTFGSEHIVKLTLELSRPRAKQMFLFVDQCYDHEEAQQIVSQLEQVLQIIYNHCQNIHTFELGNTFQGSLSISLVEWQRVIDRYAGKILPNLKDIRITVNWVRCTCKYSIVVNALIGMLVGSAVQLQSLKFDGEYGTSEQSLLQRIISRLRSPKLEEIKVYFFALPGETLLALSTHIGFPHLSTVRFELDETVTVIIFRQFLARYSNSLTKVHLENVGLEFCHFPLGVTMGKLNHLKLQNFRGTIDWTKLPILKEVILENSLLHGVVHSITNAKSPCTLDCLRIEGKHERESLAQFHSLFTQIAQFAFPNLVNLYLSHVRQLPVQVVFSKCKLLRRLKLWGSIGISDTAMCGVNIATVNIRWPTKKDLNGCANASERDALYEHLVDESKVIKRISGYVGELKELRYLEIIDWEAEFSETSVLLGIIHCKKLQEIKLQSIHMSSERSAAIISKAKLSDLVTLELNDEKFIKVYNK